MRLHGTILGLAVVGLASCSATRLNVQIDPPTVQMQTVEIDGKAAAPSGKPGEFYAGVKVEGEGGRRVPVMATSTDGVVARDSALVESGKTNVKVLRMPAEVEVQIIPPEHNATVTIDDEPVSLQDGVFRRSIDLPNAEREVLIKARNEQDNVDQRRVTVASGQRKTVRMSLEVAASFTPDRDALRFGQEVVFDASASTPRASLQRYLWKFGDGKEAVTKEPEVRYRYEYDPTVGERGNYKVELRVATAARTSPPVYHTLDLSLGREDLALDLTVYPRARTRFHPTELLQFVFTPRPGFFPQDVKDVEISFGDGKSVTTDTQGLPFTIRCNDGKCEPIVVPYAYTTEGRFKPSVTYRHATEGLGGPFTADLNRGKEEPTITVTPAYLTDDELKQRAWEDLYNKLDRVLESTVAGSQGEKQLKERRLALTSIDEANFEDDHEFVAVVERLTRMLVTDGYHVLEKNSQVLARLAPEAVVDIRDELQQGVEPKPSNQQVYRPNLDYGLATAHKGPQKPIEYSLRLEGTEDRLLQFDRSNNDAAQQQSGQTESGGDVVSASQRNKDIAALRNLPILVARFETAENLVALRVIDVGSIEESPAASYSELFDKPMTRRRATAKIRVRILERTGRILEDSDVEGEFSELVIE